LDANNAKAYFRKGMAAFSLDEFETAKQAFLKAQELSPSPQNKTWIRKCDAELEDEKDADEESSEDIVIKSPAPSKKPTADGPPPLEPDEPKKTQVYSAQSAQPVTSENPPAKPIVPSGPKHDWYQTNTHVMLSILIKNVKKEDAKINIGEKNIDIEVKLPGNTEYQMNFNLLDTIIVSESTCTVLSTKIELKLKKSRESRWPSLEDTGATVQAWDAVIDPKKEKGLTYPSSKNNQKDWDKVEVPPDNDDKLDGDAALNKLFQDIYKGASDDQRRAMLKSFQESGGTVLSTNWDEVGKGEVKGQPPKGLEMKYWKDL